MNHMIGSVSINEGNGRSESEMFIRGSRLWAWGAEAAARTWR